MKKKSLVSGIVVLLVVISMLAGCAAAPVEPEKPADQVIKEGMENLYGITSYKYDVDIKGDMTDEFGDDLNFDVTLKGALDNKDEKDPKVDLVVVGSATDDLGSGASINADLKVNKDAMYFNVASLDVTEGPELPEEVIELFGKWWMIALPPGTLDEATTVLPSGEKDEEFKKALREAQLFKTPQYKGVDNVMGESSHRYSVTVDKKGLVNFFKALAESEGETVSAADLAEAEAQLQNTDISGDVWVGTQSNVLNKFEGTITLKGGEGEPSGDINVSVSLGDINQPVTLSVPTGAEEFPMEQLLGPLMGPAMMMDESMMMDDTEMTDEEIEEFMKDADISGAEFEEMMEDLEVEMEDLEVEMETL